MSYAGAASGSSVPTAAGPGPTPARPAGDPAGARPAQRLRFPLRREPGGAGRGRGPRGRPEVVAASRHRQHRLEAAGRWRSQRVAGGLRDRLCAVRLAVAGAGGEDGIRDLLSYQPS